MRSRLLNDHGGLRTFALVFEAGDEVPGPLIEFAREHQVSGAQFTAIGAFSRVTLGYFERATKEYLRIPVDEQVEVLMLAGNIGVRDGEPAVHAHVTVGRRDGSAFGGHLLGAAVWPTLELVVFETPAYLTRRMVPESGLALLDLQG